MNYQKKEQKGFTLIELLVVIAIIAILSIVVILTLNPAELLKQARDSNRISDMGTLKSTISLYLADVSSPNLVSSTVANPYTKVFTSVATGTATVPGTATWGVNRTGDYVTSTVNFLTTGAKRNVDSTGWIPVNFTSISSGAPIGNLPVDPLDPNTGASGFSFYAYWATSTGPTFKLAAHMESAKYGFNGASDVVSTDGGVSTSTYEQGTNLNL